jgi:hypothetical protein
MIKVGKSAHHIKRRCGVTMRIKGEKKNLALLVAPASNIPFVAGA